MDQHVRVGEKEPKERARDPPQRGLAGVSYRDHSIPHEVEPDHPRAIGVVREVAEHRVARYCLQSIEVVRLREDGYAQGARRIPAFWRYLDGEDDLVHVTTSNRRGPAASL